jgi:hypothetical protein
MNVGCPNPNLQKRESDTEETKPKKIDRVHLLKTISGDAQTKNATEINRKSNENELFFSFVFFCKQKTLDALNNKNTF